jgi:hypothetical protein
MIGVLAFWNPAVGSAQSRFLIPMIPFLYLYMLLGTSWIANSLLRKHRQGTQVLSAALLSVVLLLSVARNVQDWRSPVRDRIKDLSVGTAWIAQHSAPESIVMSRDPVPDYLYARRRTVPYPTTGSDIEEYLRTREVDYIVVAPKLQTPKTTLLDEYTRTALVPLIESKPAEFQPVFTSTVHNVMVYRVESGD